MQNFMKTIINSIKTWTKKEIKDSVADWNENDSSKDSYVKNRTHWEESIAEVILPEQTIDGFALMQSSIYAIENAFTMSPIVGNTYTVMWDGISYNVMAKDFNDMIYIGNPNYVTMTAGGDIPFTIIFGSSIFVATESTANSHVIGITISNAVVHKLDSKYLDLPVNLATTDDVESAKQEAVDVANNKMDATNPVGIGSFSMNRKSGTIVGDYSHAEGYNTEASGRCSHAEGKTAVASGDYSHAEGRDARASGDFSHAEGYSAYAYSEYQHVQGKFNISDPDSKYSHIVGNGTSGTARSNAHTIDWDGNAWYQGDVYVGSNSGTNKDDGSKKLATEEYVNEAVGNIEIPEADLSNYYTKGETDLLIPEVPNRVGAFVNDAGYQTQEQVQALIDGIDIPTGGSTWNVLYENLCPVGASSIITDETADGTKLSELNINELLITGTIFLSGSSKIRFEHNGKWTSGNYLTTTQSYGNWAVPFTVYVRQYCNAMICSVAIEKECAVLTGKSKILSHEIWIEGNDITIVNNNSWVSAYFR